MTPQQLLQFQGGDFQAAASTWVSAGSEAASAAGTVSSFSGAIAGWEGPAASAAHGRLSILPKTVQPAAEALQSGEGVVAAFVSAVTTAQAGLRNAVASAAAIPATVDLSSGKVTPALNEVNVGPNPTTADLAGAQQAQQVNQQRQQEALTAEALIRYWVGEATAADQAGAGALGSSRPGGIIVSPL